MKIALFHNLPSGGAKRFTYYQVKGLVNLGHSLTEFCPSTANIAFDDYSRYLEERYVYDVVLPDYLKRKIPVLTSYYHLIQGLEYLNLTKKANQRIAEDINSKDFDVVLSADCQVITPPYILRYLKRRSVFYCHGISRIYHSYKNGSSNSLNSIKRIVFFPKNYLFKKVYVRDEYINSQYPIRIVTNSGYAKSELEKRYTREVDICYPGIDTNIFYRCNKLEKSNFIICVAALVAQKGYPFLIEAISKIPESRRPLFLIVSNNADPDEYEKVTKMANSKNVSIRIETVFDVNQLMSLYNQAKLFIFGSSDEALGLAPLEAMACGTPVLAVGEGGVRETVIDGVTGWLTDRDPKKFAERIQELLLNNSLLEAASQNCSDLIQKLWSWDASIQKLENLLKK